MKHAKLPAPSYSLKHVANSNLWLKMNTTLRHGTHDHLVTYMKVFEAHNMNNVCCLRSRGQIVQAMKSVRS